MARSTGVLTDKDRLPDAWITLTAGPIVVTPAALGRNFRVFLSEDTLIEAPHAAHDGQLITWRLEQDGTGGHTVTLNSTGFVVRGASSFAVDETAGAVTFLKAQYDADGGIWEVHGQASISSLLDDLGSAQHGSVLFRGASGWELLAPGGPGQQLTTNSSGADPNWDTA